MAQYVMNSRPSHTTKVPPYEILIGEIPKGQFLLQRRGTPMNEWQAQLWEIWDRAQQAILHSQMLMTKDASYVGYQKGNKVWLDTRNLKTTHPTHKLWAKRYGPFKVINAISHMVYQLQLLKSWKIHNVFHASYLFPYKETKEHGPNFVMP